MPVQRITQDRYAKNIISISVGAGLGALLRWWLGGLLNQHFPTIPLGTLAANLIVAMWSVWRLLFLRRMPRSRRNGVYL